MCANNVRAKQHQEVKGLVKIWLECAHKKTPNNVRGFFLV